jgi:glycerol uptake facilitator protein
LTGIRRAAAAEAYGTFLLVMIGPGTITAMRFAGLGTTGPALGVIGLAHGVALLVAVYSIGHISGAHINPAVTIAAWATHKIEARRVAPYIIAQLVGASIAGLTQLVIWSSSSQAYSVAQTTFLGDTLPGSSFTVGAALLAEVVGTAILVFTIFGATDKKADSSWAGVAIGLVLAAVIWMFGPVSGASLNPARTLGPTLASAAFSLTPINTLWIYIVGPIFGGLLGGFLYEVIRPRHE